MKQEIDGWLDVAEIEKGPIFRRVLANGRVGKDALTERAVWQLVREYAAQIGIGELAPHDLRRTAAKLCRSKGGELEQIQFLLGHESILTTERYLGSEQNLKNAVNDAPVFECRLDVEFYVRSEWGVHMAPENAWMTRAWKLV